MPELTPEERAWLVKVVAQETAGAFWMGFLFGGVAVGIVTFTLLHLKVIQPWL